MLGKLSGGRSGALPVLRIPAALCRCYRKQIVREQELRAPKYVAGSPRERQRELTAGAWLLPPSVVCVYI